MRKNAKHLMAGIAEKVIDLFIEKGQVRKAKNHAYYLLKKGLVAVVAKEEDRFNIDNNVYHDNETKHCHTLSSDDVLEYLAFLVKHGKKTKTFYSLCSLFYQGNKWGKKISRSKFSEMYHAIKDFDLFVG